MAILILIQSNFLEYNQALEALNKEHYIFAMNVFANRNYFALAMQFIEIRVKISQICLIPSFNNLWQKIH